MEESRPRQNYGRASTKKIFKLAGGFSKTAWEDAEFNSEITQTYDRSHVKLYDDIVQPEPEPVISLEAAPDPNDATAVAQWSKLTDGEKLSITQEVVPWVINRVALETKTHIDKPSLQRGGYEGTSNYSMATTIEGGSDYVRVARLLATYLRQDSVMAISATPGAGMFPGKLIRIKLPEGYSTEQIDELYNALDGIRDADGNRLIEGHSSVNGIMTIAVEAAKLAEIKNGIVTVLQNFEPMEVHDSDANIGFLTPYNTKEQENAGNLDGNSGAKSGIRTKVSAQYNDNLRRETAEMVARKIRERLEARTGSAQDRSSQNRSLTQPRPLTQRDVARALEQLGYHGSPYHFDRFTLSHIGSGEGAQAHGWGLYFALSRRTAEGYRKRLAGASTYTYNGKSLDELHNELYRELQAQLTEPTSSDKFAKTSLLTSKMLLLTSFIIGGKGNVKFEKTASKSTQDAYKWLTEEVYPNLKLEKGGKVYTVEIPDDDVLLHEEFSLRS